MIFFTILIILICFLQEFGRFPNSCKAKQIEQEISTTTSNILDVISNPPKIDNISEKEIGIVILDAGHGGIDEGSIGNGYFEKDITLSITSK